MGIMRDVLRGANGLLFALGLTGMAWAGAKDLMSDTWVATDGLGRILPGATECGAPREDKYVGIFYFLWLGQHGTGGPYDNTKLLEANPTDPEWGPESAFHHWGESELGYYLSSDQYVVRRHAQMLVDAGVDTIIIDNSNGFPYYDNLTALCETYRQIRSEGGRTPQIMLLAHNDLVPYLFRNFYCGGDDMWTMLNQITNFAVNQGVMEFDVAGDDPFMFSPSDLGLNAGSYSTLRLRIKNETSAADAQLYWTTQASTSFSETKSVSFAISAHDTQFKEYQIDLSGNAAWTGTIMQLRLDPVAHGDAGHVSIDWIELGASGTGGDETWDFEGRYPELWFTWQGKPMMLTAGDPSTLSQATKDFFTLRQCWAWSAAAWFGTGQDKWTWLDHYPQEYGWSVSGQPEEISVCAAQHPVTNIGRSFHSGSGPSTPSPEQGLCFAEQWRQALNTDPDFIFVTGWNEWVAQRFINTGSQNTFVGQTLPVGGTYFVDCYNQEYSRDIEPMKGGHTDNYYYQMIDSIRRYKGVREIGTTEARAGMQIDGDFGDWSSLASNYLDWSDDTAQRNTTGWGSAGTYVNTTGRNDLVTMKVAHDTQYLYFYVQTQSAISAYTGEGWMWLLIDADQDAATGWQGYDYLVNGIPTDSSHTTVEKCSGTGWNWTTVASISYRVVGNQLELKVLPETLGLDRSSGEYDFDFHWVDNPQPGLTVHGSSVTADPASFWINGDNAPARRFNYRYLGQGTTPVSVCWLTLE